MTNVISTSSRARAVVKTIPQNKVDHGSNIFVSCYPQARSYISEIQAITSDHTETIVQNQHKSVSFYYKATDDVTFNCIVKTTGGYITDDECPSSVYTEPPLNTWIPAGTNVIFKQYDLKDRVVDTITLSVSGEPDNTFTIQGDQLPYSYTMMRNDLNITNVTYKDK